MTSPLISKRNARNDEKDSVEIYDGERIMKKEVLINKIEKKHRSRKLCRASTSLIKTMQATICLL
jgi:hypothetical protein